MSFFYICLFIALLYMFLVRICGTYLQKTVGHVPRIPDLGRNAGGSIMTVTVEPGAGAGGVQGQLLGRAEAGRAITAQLPGTRKGFQRSCGLRLAAAAGAGAGWSPGTMM